MKAIKDQVRDMLAPSLSVSEQNLNRAYRRFVRYNGPDCHPYYAACKIVDFLKTNDRVQSVTLSKPTGLELLFEATPK